jgi:hypothetical protein
MSPYEINCLWFYSPCGPWPLFQFLHQYTVGRTPWAGDQPVSRPILTHRTTQTENKRTQTSMPRVGFEPMTTVFQRAKTVHALDRLVTQNKTFSRSLWGRSVSRNMASTKTEVTMTSAHHVTVTPGCELNIRFLFADILFCYVAYRFICATRFNI